MANIAFMPKGKIYANHAFVHKGKIYAKAVIVYITTAFYAIEFGVKSPCEESWPPLQSYSYIKGKFYAELNYWGYP